MNHISNLVGGTVCGKLYSELSKRDRMFAAFVPETQAMITCPECREKLGLKEQSK